MEKYFCVGAQIVGGFVYAMIIASLTAVVTFQESNDRMKNEKQRSAAKTTSVTNGRSAGALFCCSSTFTSLRETLK